MPNKRKMPKVACDACGHVFAAPSENQAHALLEVHRTSPEHKAALERLKTAKFFLPGATDGRVAEESYIGIRRFVQETVGRPISDRRIFALSYRHDGECYFAEVGKTERRTGEIVIAILESTEYFVCTPNCGVLRGHPLIVGRSEAGTVWEFQM